MYFFLLQIWNIGHISVSVLAARHDSSSAPAVNSRRKEWQLAWRCCRRRQPTATAAPTCAPPTLLADPGAPSPDPLPHLGVCTISYSSPFPFLIRFDDSSAGCVLFDCRRRSRPGAPLQVQRGEFVDVVQAPRFTFKKVLLEDDDKVLIQANQGHSMLSARNLLH